MHMDIRTIDQYVEGYITHRETRLNDSLLVAHKSAILTSLAVWGSKDFPKEVETIRLRPKTEEEERQAFEAEQLKIAKQITAMMNNNRR